MALGLLEVDVWNDTKPDGVGLYVLSLKEKHIVALFLTLDYLHMLQAKLLDHLHDYSAKMDITFSAHMVIFEYHQMMWLFYCLGNEPESQGCGSSCYPVGIRPKAFCHEYRFLWVKRVKFRLFDDESVSGPCWTIACYR